MSESRLDEIDAIAAARIAVFRRSAGVTILPYLPAAHAAWLDRAVAAPLRELNLRQELAAHHPRLPRGATAALAAGDPDAALAAAAPAALPELP